MAAKSTIVSEETVQTSDGTRLLTTYKSPLYNIDGSVMGTVGVGIDVTQERAYEDEIVEKNRTMETIFTTMDCGVITHSLDGTRLLGINQAALDILGYDSAEDSWPPASTWWPPRSSTRTPGRCANQSLP